MIIAPKAHNALYKPRQMLLQNFKRYFFIIVELQKELCNQRVVFGVHMEQGIQVMHPQVQHPD
jgi:hypothetical protein